MTSHRRGVRQVLRAFVLSTVAALAVAGPVGAAHAQTHELTAATTPAQDPGSAIQLNGDQQSLTATDRDLVNRVRQAGLWEGQASRMAMKKGVEPRVRQIGQMIAAQHVTLDALDAQAAQQLGLKLPTQPTDEQKRWLSEMAGASGPEFDAIFVERLRAAHGKIFPIIGVVRSTTRNAIIRKLAAEANDFVLNHLTLLESTGLVQYAELPQVIAPPVGPISTNTVRQAKGGIAIPLIWIILGVALVSGMLATAKIVRPRSFGGKHMGEQRADRVDPARPVPDTGPRGIPLGDDYGYPRPRARQRSNPRSLV